MLGTSDATVTFDCVENRDILEARDFLPLPALGAVAPAKEKNGQSGDLR